MSVCYAFSASGPQTVASSCGYLDLSQLSRDVVVGMDTAQTRAPHTLSTETFPHHKTLILRFFRPSVSLFARENMEKKQLKQGQKINVACSIMKTD